MQISFSTPERCLLVQAAHWFIDGTEPLPDEIYLSAPAELKTENSEMGELFLALKAGDFDVTGELVAEFRKYEKVPLDAQQKEVSYAGPILLSGKFATYALPMPPFFRAGMPEKTEINIGRLILEDFDFANSKLKINPIWLDESSDLILISFIEFKYPEEEGWVYDCFFRKVTVDFSKLSVFLSDKNHRFQPKPTSIGGEKKCERWLVEMMKGGKSPEMPKPDYLKEAQESFTVSQRGFDRAWTNAIKLSGNSDWSKPGRKS